MPVGGVGVDGGTFVVNTVNTGDGVDLVGGVGVGGIDVDVDVDEDVGAVVVHFLLQLNCSSTEHALEKGATLPSSPPQGVS